jgi:hypothetical protein
LGVPDARRHHSTIGGSRQHVLLDNERIKQQLFPASFDDEASIDD